MEKFIEEHPEWKRYDKQANTMMKNVAKRFLLHSLKFIIQKIKNDDNEGGIK